jgi:hypothetical protein
MVFRPVVDVHVPQRPEGTMVLPSATIVSFVQIYLLVYSALD